MMIKAPAKIALHTREILEFQAIHNMLAHNEFVGTAITGRILSLIINFNFFRP